MFWVEPWVEIKDWDLGLICAFLGTIDSPGKGNKLFGYVFLSEGAQHHSWEWLLPGDQEETI